MRIRALATVLTLGLAAGCSSPGGVGGPYYPLPDSSAGDTAGGGDQAGTTDPGAGVDPGTMTDPGPGVDPGPTPDPGTATDPGATSDPGATPDPGPQDTGPQVTTIPQIQSNSNAQGCDAAAIDTLALVNVTNVVVTTPTYAAFTPTDGGTALDGFYVADPAGGPWSGISVVMDSSKVPTLAPGDVVSITGESQEYYCETQLEALAVAVTGSQSAPAPLKLAPESVAQEQYEGMLLAVDGVEVTETIAGGVYRVTGGFIVAHQFDFFLTMTAGTTYNVAGVLAYEYGEYRLMPRSEADVVAVGGGGPTTTASALQQTVDSASCVVEDLMTISYDHVIDGVIAVGPWEVSTSLVGFSLVESSDAWGAIMLAAPTSLGLSLGPGDQVRVTGNHVEAWCQTQITASAIEVLGATTPPSPVALGSFPSGDVEPWEGALVTLSEVAIVGDTNWIAYGELETDAGVLIDDELAGTLTSPGVGTTLTSATGVVRYSFGSYRISPRSDADLVY